MTYVIPWVNLEQVAVSQKPGKSATLPPPHDYQTEIVEDFIYALVNYSGVLVSLYGTKY